MIIKYLFCSRTLRFLKFYLVFIRSRQFKKSLNKNSLWWGLNRTPRGWNRIPRGSNRVLLTTWVRTGYWRAHGRMAPSPSWYSLGHLTVVKIYSFNVILIYFRKILREEGNVNLLSSHTTHVLYMQSTRSIRNVMNALLCLKKAN